MRVLMTIVAVATQATGTYCEESLSPAFAHIWVCSPSFPPLGSHSNMGFPWYIGSCHRVRLRLYCHVLLDPILLPSQKGHQEAPSFLENYIHQAGDFLVLLAIGKPICFASLDVTCLQLSTL